MKATFVDLRTKSSEILQALERNEAVTILYRGQPKAVMQPVGTPGVGTPGRSPFKARDHAAFGLWEDRSDWQDVDATVRSLRQGRFDAH
jgi:antitoxin (DNA-binding transcriptional repressor) of toxin-antitoxin stability system